MSALLDSLRYNPSDVTGAASSEDLNAESKFGIPRFGGEAAGLAEYAFRVRARIQREALMDKEETKKYGPLGLRLIEGLRGTALRMAQSMESSVLASEKGPEELLRTFESALKPRREQEARELYAAGCRDGGMLSRQAGEPMSSYLLRRKTWWNALQQLDKDLQVSESILAEQLLVNANVTEDQRLMIRTVLGNQLKVTSVSDELLNQHPRIHEREQRQRKGGHQHGKPWRKPFKGFGKFRTFYAEGGDGEWEQAEDEAYASYVDEPQETYEDYEGYAAVTEDVNDYDQFLAENVAWYVDEGLDFENEEACALAAESIQLDGEAYYVRNQAKGKGHHGFQGQRHFEISGQLSMQEKKARLQQLKSRTECRKCGQRGHWSGDPQCPKTTGSKSDGKGKQKTGSGSGYGKGNNKGKQPKQRVVYFAMHQEEGQQQQYYSNMAVIGDGLGTHPTSSSMSSPSRPLQPSPSSSPNPMTSLPGMSTSLPASSSNPMPSLPRMPTSSSMTRPMGMTSTPTVQNLLEQGYNADQVLNLLMNMQQHQVTGMDLQSLTDGLPQR